MRKDPAVRFCQATKPWDSVETDPRWTNLLKARCIRSGAYKLVHVPYLRHEALYDLETDPQEQRDLLEEPTDGVLEIARQLRVQLDTWAHSAQPLPSTFVTSQRDEVLERLKALGYAGGP